MSWRKKLRSFVLSSVSTAGELRNRSTRNWKKLSSRRQNACGFCVRGTWYKSAVQQSNCMPGGIGETIGETAFAALQTSRCKPAPSAAERSAVQIPGNYKKRSIPDGIDLLELLGRFELPDARRCAASIRCGLKMRLRRRRSAVQIPGNYKKDLSRMG